MRTTEELKQEALALFEAQRLERARDYAQRGRRFAKLTDAEALDEWRRAFTTWTFSLNDADLQRAEEDAQAELDLRGLQPDYESVRDRFEVLMSASRAMSDALQSHPEERRRVGLAMLDDLDEHQRAQAVERARPN